MLVVRVLRLEIGGVSCSHYQTPFLFDVGAANFPPHILSVSVPSSWNNHALCRQYTMNRLANLVWGNWVRFWGGIFLFYVDQSYINLAESGAKCLAHLSVMAIFLSLIVILPNSWGQLSETHSGWWELGKSDHKPPPCFLYIASFNRQRNQPLCSLTILRICHICSPTDITFSGTDLMFHHLLT